MASMPSSEGENRIHDHPERGWELRRQTHRNQFVLAEGGVLHLERAGLRQRDLRIGFDPTVEMAAQFVGMEVVEFVVVVESRVALEEGHHAGAIRHEGDVGVDLPVLIFFLAVPGGSIGPWPVVRAAEGGRSPGRRGQVLQPSNEIATRRRPRARHDSSAHCQSSDGRRQRARCSQPGARPGASN